MKFETGTVFQRTVVILIDPEDQEMMGPGRHRGLALQDCDIMSEWVPEVLALVDLCPRRELELAKHEFDAPCAFGGSVVAVS